MRGLRCVRWLVPPTVSIQLMMRHESRSPAAPSLTRHLHPRFLLPHLQGRHPEHHSPRVALGRWGCLLPPVGLTQAGLISYPCPGWRKDARRKRGWASSSREKMLEGQASKRAHGSGRGEQTDGQEHAKDHQGAVFGCVWRDGRVKHQTLTAEVIPVKPPTAVFPRHPPISICPSSAQSHLFQSFHPQPLFPHFPKTRPHQVTDSKSQEA